MQVVAPKKAKLDAATAEFEALQVALTKKKEILKEVEEKLQKLQEELETMEQKKSALEQDVQNCQKAYFITIKLSCCSYLRQ